MNDFYQAALKIAHRKLFYDAVPSKLKSPRLGTGGEFSDIFLWDTVFSAHWAKYHAGEFPLTDSLDNFYCCQDSDGFISRQINPEGHSKWNKRHPVSFAPPLLSWIELELHQTGLYPERLKKVYPALTRFHRFNRRWKRQDGLYFSDMWGCGMDDIPRWNPEDKPHAVSGSLLLHRSDILTPGEQGDRLYAYMNNHKVLNFNWNSQLAWIDTSAQVAFDCANLAEMADVLGIIDDAREFRLEHDELAERINELLYDEQNGFYCDRLESGLVNHLHVGGFWTLLGGVATRERAARLCEHLINPHTFGLPCGIPGISCGDPCFDVNKYWCGPVWCPTEYMVLCGLRKYGENALAHDLAVRFYQAVRNIWRETDTIWENYSPLQSDSPSKSAARDFCGWSVLAPVTIFREFVCVDKASCMCKIHRDCVTS